MRWRGPGTGIALLAIAAYQRFVSPYKGFACAYRLHTGRASCSMLACRAIRRHGLFTGLGPLDQRLDRCGQASQQLRTAARRLDLQAGLCDLSCDLPCDLDGCHGSRSGLSNCASSGCDCANCSSCDGREWRECREWRQRRSRRHQRDREQWVSIPPTHNRRRHK